MGDAEEDGIRSDVEPQQAQEVVLEELAAVEPWRSSSGGVDK